MSFQGENNRRSIISPKSGFQNNQPRETSLSCRSRGSGDNMFTPLDKSPCVLAHNLFLHGKHPRYPNSFFQTPAHAIIRYSNLIL